MAESFDRVIVVTGEKQTEIEDRVARLLVQRITDQSGIRVSMVPENQPPAASERGILTIYLGVPARHSGIASILAENKIPPPTTRNPGGEGFVLKTISQPGRTVIMAAGVDERGALYAVGEILRRMTFGGGRISFSSDLEIRTAPAFKVRGLIVSQGHTMLELTGARAWTADEWQRAVLDYALAGANAFELGASSSKDRSKYDFIKSYGLDVLNSCSANTGDGPPEWRAIEGIGRQNYLCPSIPEARKALLDAWEARWKNCLPCDYLRIKSGDGGGCECDRCRPFGAVYIRLVEDMAKIVRRYSPKTKILVANQKLDNAGDQAIFDYLKQTQPDWMDAFCYGPGSNAMGWMPGRRQDHRIDLFDHPGFGPNERYLQEILHQLPAHIDIVHFTDLTHWVYSQYGLMDHELIPDRDQEVPPPWDHWIYDKRPDPAFAQVYNRRTFHARPKHYHRIFQETMRYAIGDVAYSEGHHDHMNTWIWQRLLWSPHQSAEEVSREYARTWFGPDAAGLMTEALFLHEDNLDDCGDNRADVDRLPDMIRKTGGMTPPDQLEKNYLWRQYLQKALLDKYIKHREARQFALQADVERILGESLKSGDTVGAIKKAQERMSEDIETAEMKALRAEAKRIGEESDRIFGMNNDGLFNLDLDLVGLGWLEEQLKEARDATEKERQGIIDRIVNYEDAGEGGFYDNAGDPKNSPHLTYGWPYGDGGFSQYNRRSQRNTAFTTVEDQGVTFEYDGLDPEAQYRARFTLLRPVYLPRYAMFQKQTTQSIYANDFCLAKDLELPPSKCRFFEFDIPAEATRSGKLKIMFRKSEGVGTGAEQDLTIWRNTGGWGTLCSEVWLMKKR
ncbi:MAG TPA: hypothetical protein PL033_00485 [Candidatus Brocadiia bacterium]|nr:hypothetical protein [Candidatus Brocadiia bacterium]